VKNRGSTADPLPPELLSLWITFLGKASFPMTSQGNGRARCLSRRSPPLDSFPTKIGRWSLSLVFFWLFLVILTLGEPLNSSSAWVRQKLSYRLIRHWSHEAWSREPHGGCQLSWFMTRFESRGAQECDEQWNAMGTRVYTGSGLPEDNSSTSCVHRLYYDCLGQDPLYPSFYMLRG
jgi:hypothetical protein